MIDNSKIIIECIRTGKNNEALKYLYKGPLKKIRKFILMNSGTLDDANDVFQDAVIVLFQYVKNGKYNEAHDLDGFLFKVAKNAWIDISRKKQRTLSSSYINEEIHDEADYLNDIISKEQLNMFHQLFNQLEENCRKILSYVIFEKKSMKEISLMMGLKDEKVAKNQHYRCKKYFTKIVSDNKEAITLLKN